MTFSPDIRLVQIVSYSNVHGGVARTLVADKRGARFEEVKSYSEQCEEEGSVACEL